MAFSVYDPASVVVSFKGNPLSGYADGSFVSVSLNENQFELQVGSDGESCRSRTNNQSATMTVTLLHTSASNGVLHSLHNEDLLARGTDQEGAGKGVFSVKDNNGNTLVTANNAWITKFPDVEFDRESTSREWEFMTDKIVFKSL